MTSCSKRKWDDHDDVFYTNRTIVERCVVDLTQTAQAMFVDEAPLVVVDFSAGDGYFCDALRARCAAVITAHQYDQSPRSASVQESDWFAVEPFKCDLIGFNPPFGYKSVLIKKFLAHAARFEPDIIAFIMPRVSWNILPPGYGIVFSKELEAESFYSPTTDASMPVPGCSFVIARKGALQKTGTATRNTEKEALPASIRRIPYSKPWPDALVHGFAIRRVGANAARIIYLIHARDNITFMNDKGEERALPAFVREDGVTPLSCISFHTYITQTSPTRDFGRRLVSALRQTVTATLGDKIIPYGDAVAFSKCIAAALADDA